MQFSGTHELNVEKYQYLAKKWAKNGKHAHIWAQTLSGNNLVIFWPIVLKFFVGAQETIIYRLVMRISSYYPHFMIRICLVLHQRENGVAAMLMPKGLGP